MLIIYWVYLYQKYVVEILDEEKIKHRGEKTEINEFKNAKRGNTTTDKIDLDIRERIDKEKKRIRVVMR